MTESCPMGPASSPDSTAAQPGPRSVTGKVGGLLLLGHRLLSGSSPFQPCLALEMGLDTSQIKVRGQPTFLFAREA